MKRADKGAYETRRQGGPRPGQRFCALTERQAPNQSVFPER